jgi:hypothetical protein
MTQSTTAEIVFERSMSSNGPRMIAGEARKALEAKRELSSDELQNRAPIAADSRVMKIHVKNRICPPLLCFCVRRKQVAKMTGPRRRRRLISFAQRSR